MPPMAIHQAQTFPAPDQASHVLARAIGGGDIEMASGCFTSDACFVAPDATTANGRDEIRSVITQMIGLDTRVVVEASTTLIAGDLALVSEHWQISYRDVHGTPFRQMSPANMVLRKIGDDWTLVIAAPWGWGSYDRG